MILDFANTTISTNSIKFTTTLNDPPVDWYRNFILKQMSWTTNSTILRDLKHEYDTYKPTYKIIIVFVDNSELYESFDSEESRDIRVNTLKKFNVKFIKE